MTPVMGVGLGVVLLGESVTWQMLVGGAMALAGVGIIGVRRNRRFPEAPVGDKMSQ
jgi:O-acetylserine/cysteine efflux transporter